ncbi:MAG: hypothetical protein AAF221_08910 [Pseudomonadota bacterium]
MNPGALFGSLTLHALIVLALSITLPLMNPPEAFDMPPVIAVDLVAIGSETIVKTPEPEEPAQEVIDEAPVVQPKKEAPPEDVDVAEPTLKEDAAVAPQEAAKPEPKVEAKPEPAKKETPKPEPEEKVNEKETLADLARLIDRSKEEKATPEDLENDLFASFGKTRRAKSRDSREQSISLTDAARSQVAKCWNLPLGGKDVQSMRVTVNVLLAPDGGVVGAPTLDPADKRRMQRSDETTFNAFALSALRAVRRCAPYSLPKERYEEWKSLRLNFDPSQMLN